MKQLQHLLSACLLLLAASPILAQRLTFTPDKPIAGEKVMLQYNPAGSDLAGISEFDAVAYFFEGGDEARAMEIPLTFDGKMYSGSLDVSAGAKAVLFSLKNEEKEVSDNNDGKGYKFVVSKADRQTPVQGAYAAKSMIYGGYGYLGDVKKDAAKGLELIKKEFDTHPASKGDDKLFRWYANMAKAQKDEAALADVKATLEKTVANKKATEDDLMRAAFLAGVVGEEAQAKSLNEMLKRKYPNGKLVKQETIKSFKEAKDIPAKIAVYDNVKKTWGKDKDIVATLNNLASAIAYAYSEQEDWANFDKYLAMMTDKSRKAGLLNDIAWTLAGEGLNGEAKNAEVAKKYSALSLELLDQEMEKQSGKPASVTNKQYKNNLKFSYGMYADTYAVALFRTGNAAEAFKYQQIANDQNKFSDGEMNERYAMYLEKAKGGKEAEKMVEKMLIEGNATSAMKEQHKRLFIANQSVESAYEKYAVALEAQVLANMKEEIRGKMLDKNAASFRLLNLKGEEVSLESMKGKVIVLDFWATWCGPCKASFPGMQKAVNKFADSKDVEFLFVDTWERVPDPLKNATDFISANKYTFNVLMDNKSEVVAAFGIDGIPTKFVIDKNGMIRFKTVGYSGNDEELVNELSIMIELAGGTVPAKLTGAP